MADSRSIPPPYSIRLFTAGEQSDREHADTGDRSQDHMFGLAGSHGSVFTSTATQHGGQESTILSFHTTLLHQGMVIVGLPHSCTAQTTLKEITGGSPYGEDRGHAEGVALRILELTVEGRPSWPPFAS